MGNCSYFLSFKDERITGSKNYNQTWLTMKYNLKKSKVCQDREHKPAEEGWQWVRQAEWHATCLSQAEGLITTTGVARTKFHSPSKLGYIFSLWKYDWTINGCCSNSFFFNYYYCNIELIVLLCTGIWHPKSRSQMPGENYHEPQEPWSAAPTGASRAPGQGALLTHKAECQNWGKETRGQQWPWRTKGAPRRAHSSHHAQGNRIMCSATGEICLLTYTAFIQTGRNHITTTDGGTKLPTVAEPEPSSWSQEQISMKANSTRTG